MPKDTFRSSKDPSWRSVTSAAPNSQGASTLSRYTNNSQRSSRPLLLALAATWLRDVEILLINRSYTTILGLIPTSSGALASKPTAAVFQLAVSPQDRSSRARRAGGFGVLEQDGYMSYQRGPRPSPPPGHSACSGQPPPPHTHRETSSKYGIAFVYNGESKTKHLL